MSKSTPINQLPSQTYSSDPPEMLAEDDAIIQDVLNNLREKEDVPKPTTPIYMPPPMPMPMPPMMPQPQMLQPMPTQPMPTALPISTYDKWMNLISSEFKLAGAIFAIVIIVQLVPFHKYISKYVAIEKIPYHEILLRAILASLSIIIIKKLLSI